VIDDTMFRGFGNDALEAYLYLGKVDSEEDAQTYLEDLGVVLVRTERKVADLQDRVDATEQRLSDIKATDSRGRTYYGYRLEEAREALPEDKSKLETVRTFYIGFIVKPGLELNDFRSQVEDAVGQYERYRTAFSSGHTLEIGGETIDLSASGH